MRREKGFALRFGQHAQHQRGKAHRQTPIRRAQFKAVARFFFTRMFIEVKAERRDYHPAEAERVFFERYCVSVQPM